jgi:hypothetical protein
MASRIRGPRKIGLRQPQSTLQRLDNQCRKHRELDYKGLERRLTLFLRCHSLFPYKFSGESLKESQLVFLIAHSFAFGIY